MGRNCRKYYVLQKGNEMKNDTSLFKRYGALLLVFAALFLVNACSWIGETAGKAQAGVEGAVKDTKEGYHKGYEEGKKN